MIDGRSSVGVSVARAPLTSRTDHALPQGRGKTEIPENIQISIHCGQFFGWRRCRTQWPLIDSEAEQIGSYGEIVIVWDGIVSVGSFSFSSFDLSMAV